MSRSRSLSAKEGDIWYQNGYHHLEIEERRGEMWRVVHAPTAHVDTKIELCCLCSVYYKRLLEMTALAKATGGKTRCKLWLGRHRFVSQG